jgi:putative ABC transport system substrate-binding protein
VRRREFITGLGGAVAAWLLTANTQQPTMPVIGFLNSTSQDANVTRIAAFRQGLAEAGFAEGKIVSIEFHHGDGVYDRLGALASDLVDRRAAVIVTTGMAAALAAKAATTTISVLVCAIG